MLELVGDVAVVHWLLGSAAGEPELLEAIHGSRLERILERLVDTPVQGLRLRGRGLGPAPLLERGAASVAQGGGDLAHPGCESSTPTRPIRTAWVDAAFAGTLRLAPAGRRIDIAKLR